MAQYGYDETLQFWADDYAEGAGVESVEVTEKLQRVWGRFGVAVDRVLEKHLTPEEYWEVTSGEGEESIKGDVYATLTGQGVGIWDGRWDGYMSEAKLKKIQVELKKGAGQWADDTGGGKLNIAFQDAAFESNPSRRRGKKKATKRKTAKRGAVKRKTPKRGATKKKTAKKVSATTAATRRAQTRRRLRAALK